MIIVGEIIDVKAMTEHIRAKIARATETLKNKHGVTPTLKVILVGEDPASISYTKGKAKACIELGLANEIIKLPATITEEELLEVVNSLNEDDSVNGFMVQVPLPSHLNEQKILDQISLEKDIDGFHPQHLGNLLLGLPAFIPCTPKGIIAILDGLDYDLTGKQVVIVGRSNIVGKPISILALERHATVTICHSRTENLSEVTQLADVLIVAIGRPHFITKEYVKLGSIIIDVGVNRTEGSKKLLGDVDTIDVLEKVAAITPVPGGVGPMTITMLLQNTIQATCQQHNIDIADALG